MSDDDFMQDSDEEEYDFEYEDDDDDNEPDAGEVTIENKYYNAKQTKLTDADEAIREFLGIPALEADKGEWGFKGLKQAIKLEFGLGRFDAAVAHYQELLTYVRSAVTRNYSEKSINNLLDFFEKGAAGGSAAAGRAMAALYELTLACFQATHNERLWLKTSIKQARLLLARAQYGAVAARLRALHAACQRADGGGDDPSKGTYLLEIYALEIQMHAARRNTKQLRPLYERALAVRSAVPHPRIMGIIRECGGKMHMAEENWTQAQSAFFESFRNYDEAGSLQRIQVLKYLLLTTMLMRSDINPFDSQETKPYRHDPRIAAMTALVDAYQHDDIRRYEAVLAAHPDLLHDAFIAENIDEVTRTMRTKAVLRLIAPYTRLRTRWIADQIRIPDAEVLDILGFLIVDRRIFGTIDEHAGILEIDSCIDADRVHALAHLSASVAALSDIVLRNTAAMSLRSAAGGSGAGAAGVGAGGAGGAGTLAGVGVAAGTGATLGGLASLGGIADAADGPDGGYLAPQSLDAMGGVATSQRRKRA